VQPVHESFFWRCRGACISLACTALLVSSDQPCVVKTAGTYFVWCMQISVHMRESWSMDCGVLYQLEHPFFQRGGGDSGECRGYQERGKGITGGSPALSHREGRGGAPGARDKGNMKLSHCAGAINPAICHQRRDDEHRRQMLHQRRRKHQTGCEQRGCALPLPRALDHR